MQLIIPEDCFLSIWVVEDKILQVLYNIVNNAGRSTTTVIINVKSNRQDTIISISDNGIGRTEQDSMMSHEIVKPVAQE